MPVTSRRTHLGAGRHGRAPRASRRHHGVAVYGPHSGMALAGTLMRNPRLRVVCGVAASPASLGSFRTASGLPPRATGPAGPAGQLPPRDLSARDRVVTLLWFARCARGRGGTDRDVSTALRFIARSGPVRSGVRTPARHAAPRHGPARRGAGREGGAGEEGCPVHVHPAPRVGPEGCVSLRASWSGEGKQETPVPFPAWRPRRAFVALTCASESDRRYPCPQGGHEEPLAHGVSTVGFI